MPLSYKQDTLHCSAKLFPAVIWNNYHNVIDLKCGILQGVFRDQGIIMLCTSWIQTVNIDHDNMLYATGQRNRLAQFRVHKVAEGNIRMFESVVFPKQYIRFKEGRCDCQVNCV